MTDAYRARLEDYLATMLQAKTDAVVGIITPEDYAILIQCSVRNLEYLRVVYIAGLT